jgi:hypothetical protein
VIKVGSMLQSPPKYTAAILNSPKNKSEILIQNHRKSYEHLFKQHFPALFSGV